MDVHLEMHCRVSALLRGGGGGGGGKVWLFVKS